MVPADIFALATLIVSVLTLVVIILDFFGFKERVKERQKIGAFAALLMVGAIYYLVRTNINLEEIGHKTFPEPSPSVSAPTPIKPLSSSAATPTPTLPPVPTPTSIPASTEVPVASPIPVITPQPDSRDQVPRTTVTMPSFPCWKANTAVEITICHTPELADKEQQMSAAYGAVLHALTGTDQRKFRRQHYEWFKQYSSECNSLAGSENVLKDCIRRYLTTHTEELRQRLSNLK